MAQWHVVLLVIDLSNPTSWLQPFILHLWDPHKNARWVVVGTKRDIQDASVDFDTLLRFRQHVAHLLKLKEIPEYAECSAKDVMSCKRVFMSCAYETRRQLLVKASGIGIANDRFHKELWDPMANAPLMTRIKHRWDCFIEGFSFSSAAPQYLIGPSSATINSSGC